MYELRETPAQLVTLATRTANPLQLKKQNYYTGLKADSETN